MTIRSERPQARTLQDQSLITASQQAFPIVETFHSLQGEGYWAGRSAYFIRLAGCNVGCPWCDTKESWNAARMPKRSVQELVGAAIAAQPTFVVITGGEPLTHDLTELTHALALRGLTVHLETSGAYPLTGKFDWITLSPHPHRPPHPSLYAQVHQLKVVIANPSDLEWAEQQSALVGSKVHRFLQPEWNTPDSNRLVTEYVKAHPAWRVSLQTHKYLGIH